MTSTSLNSTTTEEQDGGRAPLYSTKPRNISCGIVIRNLPKKVKQYELEALFAPVPGTVAVSLTLHSEHAACLLMSSTETASALMNSDWKHNAYCRDQKMDLEYAELGLQNRMLKELFPAYCWICASCGMDNIPKRERCFSCHALRSLSCGYVDPTVPSRVVRVSHVDTRVSESEIETMVKTAAPVFEVKFSRDLKTGKHKGSFHCYFFTVQDAEKVVNVLKQSWEGVCVEYCMEKKGYAPEKTKKKDVNEQPHITNVVAEGFELDPISGYYLREKSTGLYYDPNSGYFYDQGLQVWGTKDPVLGTFVPHVQQEQDIVVHSTTNTDNTIREKNNNSKNNASIHHEKQPKASVVSVQGVIHKGTWARKQHKDGNTGH
jgi:RNA recognition motif-containing protein